LAGADTQRPVEILGAGRKAASFFRRAGIAPFREWAGFWQDLAWVHADSIGQEILDAFRAGRWSRLTLVYNRFKSMMSQELVQETLLPVALECSPKPDQLAYGEYDFEPGAEAILDYLLPRYVKNALWHAMLESKAAELSARMQAMGNATQNAGEMIGELTLLMNRARQAAITREIAELVSGAEAINA
jgi:F-type H+-transporting ATPase subunit gamma